MVLFLAKLNTKLFKSFFCALLLLLNFTAQNAFALLSLELTKGVAGAVPIAISPFSVVGEPLDQNVASIIANDLKNSGRFKVYNQAVNNTQALHKLGIDTIVVGRILSLGNNQYKISFQLNDIYKSNTLIGKNFSVSASQLRAVAHHISDLIYEQILGERGVFSTRLSYILVNKTEQPVKYTLEVCDQDGYNPRSLLISTDPIMSPAWSPDGKKIAYVSFENKRASIYVQDVFSGSRELISSFPGINGAPAWSPDGNKLALVLSKSGAPNIYLMNLKTKQTTQLTKDFYINTEPAWSPRGDSIIFTSNRSGTPQIYQMNLASRSVNRLTFDGDYNARASFTRDGNHIVVLNKQSSIFNIGLLDLDSGTLSVLTHSGTDSESPTAAPNGSMVLYGTSYNGRSVLSMVTTDGSVQVRLPARSGEVQDPAWSPFLT